LTPKNGEAASGRLARISDTPYPRCFAERVCKSLKRNRLASEKEDKERERVRKLLKTRSLSNCRKLLNTEAIEVWSTEITEKGETPGGNADRCEKKGVAGKAIRKTMKTKGRQNDALFIRKLTAWEGRV